MKAINVNEIYKRYTVLVNLSLLLLGALLGYLIFHQVNQPAALPKQGPAPVGQSLHPQIQVDTKTVTKKP